jgi:predicted Rossmann fold flavoprotein
MIGPRETFDVAILGAGAAGLMCAIAAGRRGRRVLVLDHADQAGAKILISGGGRCNFTNIHTTPGQFFSNNKHFAVSALARYTPRDFLALVERHKIAWHEKTLGQLFCDGSARAIVAMLLAECTAVGVVVRLGQKIRDVSHANEFRVETEASCVNASALVLATGGLSIPKMGATGLSHDIARRFGLKLTSLRPALVPLTLDADMLGRTQKLSGVALEVVASCGRQAFREAMLFTHRGLSGPAILQISSCWRDGEAIDIDLVPDQPAEILQLRKRARPKVGLRNVLTELLPQRLADDLLPAEFGGPPIGELPDRALARLAESLKRWRVTPTGSEGYAKAEVTLGGVDTACLSSRDMAARAVPGLYVIGEAVDVTGWLGGYNFQWAWASGWAAGNAV